jgi:hypothetical protein
MMYIITAIMSIRSIIAIMLINAIFNNYLIVSAAVYTMHVVLFNMFLAYRSAATLAICLGYVHNFAWQ